MDPYNEHKNADKYYRHESRPFNNIVLNRELPSLICKEYWFQRMEDIMNFYNKKTRKIITAVIAAIAIISMILPTLAYFLS